MFFVKPSALDMLKLFAHRFVEVFIFGEPSCYFCSMPTKKGSHVCTRCKEGGAR